MTERSTRNQLLDDVLNEGEPADFRQALLSGILRGARRKRRLRATRKIGITLAVAIPMIFTWKVFNKNASRIISAMHRPSAWPNAVVTLVKSQHSIEIVVTKPLLEEETVQSASMDPEHYVVSSTSVMTVTTQKNAGNFVLLGDSELFALLSPRPVALVPVGGSAERLMFLNPEDARGFPIN